MSDRAQRGRRLGRCRRPRDQGADRFGPRRGGGTTPGGGDLHRPTLGGDGVPVGERQAAPGGAARRVRARVEATPGAMARFPTRLTPPRRSMTASPARGSRRRRPAPAETGFGEEAPGRTPDAASSPTDGAGGAARGRTVEALLFDYGLTLVSFTRPAEALLRAHEEVVRRLRAAGVGPLPVRHALLAEVHDRVEDTVVAPRGDRRPRRDRRRWRRSVAPMRRSASGSPTS